ncbi:hypothetical protein Psch_00342 [Pelotomaculum schinkii]|uniref:Uncharacterized protein n=1 Tax=Pelotomaculum schinkii TaxID=78350 RepID=A0A4Y7RDJ3_9FIRM|nr:hypothetical protein [Pelotomaculum schinkii]TEB06810.1 hypothetical protein Psch_00342 [Pelotomaculum schinkii]
MTKHLKILMLLVFLSLVVLSGCENSATSLDADKIKIKEALENEFNLIQMMPNVIKGKKNFLNNSISMVLSERYTTKNSYEEIINYYDEQLKEHGWQFYKEEKLTDWGRDYGGKSVRYKKGDFVAIVQYAGEKADYGWTYGFAITWGLYEEK